MKTGGYLLVLGDGRPVEVDTLRCCHCGCAVFLKPGSGGTVYLVPDDSPQGHHEEPGAYCGKCGAPICIPCDTGACVPLERRLEYAEAIARRLR